MPDQDQASEGNRRRDHQGKFGRPCVAGRYYRGPTKFLLMNSTALQTREVETPVEVHLRDYVRIVMKRKWAVVGLFVSVVTGAALHVLMQPSVYDSTVSLLVEPSGPNVMSKAVEEVYAPTGFTLDYYKTQYEILKSHQILREAALRLNLKAYPEYSPKPKPMGPLESWLEETKAMVVSVLSWAVTDPAEQNNALPENEAERLLGN